MTSAKNGRCFVSIAIQIEATLLPIVGSGRPNFSLTNLPPTHFNAFSSCLLKFLNFLQIFVNEISLKF